VVRDIGYIKTEKYDQRKIRAFFKNRQEAEDKLRLSLIYREFKRLRDEQALEAVDIYNWFIKQNLQRSKLSETALPLFDKICLRLGKLLEQQSAFAQALDVFCLTDQPPARERRVRILHKSGQMEAALALCRLMQDAPLNADERFFAADFCDRIRKKKRTRLATDYLRNSESVEIDSDFSKFVEAGALAVFQQQGQEGAFAENYLWRGFFGLLFWDIIFDQDAEAIHHPLQTAPSDFYTPRFLQRREEALIQRLGVLHHPSRFLKIIHHHFNTKTGMSNPMVGWHENLLMLVERCYYYLNADQLGNVLLEMARDLRENTRGFPDLFVWQGSSYCFVEIKSPNDQLSAQQLYWLRFFERQQIRAKVVRVNWQQD
jgi:hypothetical protein